MVIDDIHKLEFIFGGAAFIIFILVGIGINIYFKIAEYKLKKDIERKKDMEKDNKQDE